MVRLCVLFVMILPYLQVLVTPTLAAAPRCFSVPAIKHCIDGRFREYWEQNGGLAVFGYPITAAQNERSAEGTFLTQYFERNKFELHPEKARPYDVLLGRLGVDVLEQQGRSWEEFAKGSKSTNCLWFEATKHSVCDQGDGVGFKTYWQSQGLKIAGLSAYERSLALFGYPLSEPMVQRNADGVPVITQWFERARLEWHPNKPDTFKVLLGLLGNERRAK